MTRLVDRQWIEAHIPHQGRMCLLDQVLSWDAEQLSCRSATHQARDNPLRAGGRLGAVCAVEYAAQAVAVHAALLGTQAPRPGSFGVLASARAVVLSVERLDQISADLLIHVRRRHADARSALYEFALYAEQRSLARGRLSLLLDAFEDGRRDAPEPERG